MPPASLRVMTTAEMRLRRRLIEQTLDMWARTFPQKARAARDYLEKITAVEHSKGEWRSGKGQCTLRLPNDLWISLRRLFDNFPDIEPFAQSDYDIRLLCQLAPRLTPGGYRPSAWRS